MLFCSVVSLSARRAWIEITALDAFLTAPAVALRKESVDRNIIIAGGKLQNRVVALRKESVDRNPDFCMSVRSVKVSLSARRAWIEISRRPFVGRNYVKSLSARRAWIEMLLLPSLLPVCVVALRKESVDRNLDHLLRGCNANSRSPQGERG